VMSVKVPASDRSTSYPVPLPSAYFNQPDILFYLTWNSATSAELP
jgi:hypothetical protein